MPGSRVELSVNEGKLAVAPVTAVSYAPQVLVAGFTEANRHGVEEYGAAAGIEVW